MTSEDKAEFVQWLKKTMDRTGWTQEEFAERADMRYSTLNTYCTGKSKPSIENLRGLADASGTSLRSLLVMNKYMRQSDFREPNKLDVQEEELLHWFRQIPRSRREMVVAMLRSGVHSITGPDSNEVDNNKRNPPQH
tara:strand:- start:273 stop:683 length:411 start_codon:yes stop_codon:yes gene_type:complete